MFKLLINLIKFNEEVFFLNVFQNSGKIFSIVHKADITKLIEDCCDCLRNEEECNVSA